MDYAANGGACNRATGNPVDFGYTVSVIGKSDMRHGMVRRATCGQAGCMNILKIRVADVQDGLSNTMWVAEKSLSTADYKGGTGAGDTGGYTPRNISDTTRIGDVRPMLDTISRNNTQLRNLIDQLLDLAALDSGYAPLTITTVNLSDVAAEAIGRVRSTCEHRRVTINAQLPAELPVPGDRRRLSQVLEQLLANAVKYSPDDTTITVAATVDEDCVILSVTDQGTGLSGDETSSLFRRLYRGSNARHAGIPGSGLGLALVRAILDRHHGTITLTPNKPSGAQATIRLPRTGSMNGTGTTTEP